MRPDLAAIIHECWSGPRLIPTADTNRNDAMTACQAYASHLRRKATVADARAHPAEYHKTVSYGAVPYGKIESDPQTVLLSANRIQQASQKMPNVQFKILTIALGPALCS
jgi:hypothetical protein